MSRFLKVVVCICFVALITIAAHAQSVADAARENKNAPKARASKTYTNEEIPSAEEAAPAEKKDSDGEAAKPEESKDGEQSAETSSAEKPKENKDVGKSADAKDGDKSDSAAAADSKNVDKEWAGKVNDQKEKIASLEKEQQLTEREYKLRAAVFFADAGNRLRDDKKWADAEQKHKADTAKLDQDLTTAKEQLETLREQARKAGAKVD